MFSQIFGSTCFAEDLEPFLFDNSEDRLSRRLENSADTNCVSGLWWRKFTTDPGQLPKIMLTRYAIALCVIAIFVGPSDSAWANVVRIEPTSIGNYLAFGGDPDPIHTPGEFLIARSDPPFEFYVDNYSVFDLSSVAGRIEVLSKVVFLSE